MGADRRRQVTPFEEWLRRYPGVPARRALFELPIVLWRLGLGPLLGRVLVVLSVTGRSSGLPRHTVILPHVVGGRTYVWSPWDGRSQWFRNMVANPVVRVQSSTGTQAMRAAGIEDDDEVVAVVDDLRRVDAPYLRLYLDAEGIADTAEDIARNRHRLHIRRLDPTTEAGPAPLEANLVQLWLVPLGVAALLVRRRRRRRSAPDEQI